MARMTKANRAVMWGAGGVAAVMLALTGYAVFSGDDSGTAPGKGGTNSKTTASAKPAPSYSAPDEWTEPERWAVLPRGKHTDANGNDVGFPHTTNGAVAMMAALNSTDVEGGRTTVDVQLGAYDSYLAKTDQTPENKAKIRAQAARTDAGLRRSLGIPLHGDMPPGAYVRANVIGFKIIKASRDEVSVYLLSRVTMKAGEIEREHGSYTRNILGAQWEGKDWKLSGAATSRAAQQARRKEAPAIVAPGDAAFNANGWTGIRQAS